VAADENIHFKAFVYLVCSIYYEVVA